MSDESTIEDLAFEFFESGLNALGEDSPIFGAELHDTLYREITKEFGIRIGDGESDFVPNAGSTEEQEVDGVIPIVIFSLVTGADRSDRKAARTRMIRVAKWVSRLVRVDPTMGGRVNDARIKRVPRGWDSIKSAPYSVANMHLLVNETGGPIE